MNLRWCIIRSSSLSRNLSLDPIDSGDKLCLNFALTTPFASMSFNDSFQIVLYLLLCKFLLEISSTWNDFCFSSNENFISRRVFKSDCTSYDINWVCTGGNTTSKDTWVTWVSPRKENHYLLLFIIYYYPFKFFLSLIKTCVIISLRGINKNSQ